jgi:hypothetical protein
MFIPSKWERRGWQAVVAVVQLLFFAPLAPAGQGALEVLHVSVCEQNEARMILDQTGSPDLFSITQVGLEAFNAGSPTSPSFREGRAS